MNLWISVILLLAADFFIIFNLISKAKKNRTVHFFRMRELRTTMDLMKSQNSRLEEKVRIVAGFESSYKYRIKVIGQEIVGLQRQFLAIITSTTEH